MRRLTLRKKHKNYWCTIYLSKICGNIWNLGIVVSKSKRASNDWYVQRKNKRRNYVVNDRSVKTLADLRVCYKLLQSSFKKLPKNAEILIYNEFREAQAMSRYIERLGFVKVYHSGYPFWVLIAPKRAEVLRRS